MGNAQEKMEVDYNTRMEASRGDDSVANGETGSENSRDTIGRPKSKKARMDVSSAAAAAANQTRKKNHNNKYLEIRLPEGVNLEEMVHFCIRLLNIRRHYCKSRKAKNILVNAMQILDSTDDLDFVNKKYRTGIAQTVFFCGTYEDFCDQTRKEERSPKGTQTIECRVTEPKPVVTTDANVQTFLKRTFTKSSQTIQRGVPENAGIYDEPRSKVRHSDTSTQTDSSDDHTTSPQQQFPDSTNLNTVVNYINSYISPGKRLSRDRIADETAVSAIGVDEEYAPFRKPSENVPGILVTDAIGYPLVTGHESSGMVDDVPAPPPPHPELRLSLDNDVASQLNCVVLEDPRLVVGRRSSLECPSVLNRRPTDEAAIRETKTIVVDPSKKVVNRSTSADVVSRPALSVSPSACPVIPLENPDLGSKPSDPRITASELTPPDKRTPTTAITPKTKGCSRQAELAKKQKLKRQAIFQKKSTGSDDEKSDDSSSDPPSPPPRTGPRTPPLPEKSQEKMIVDTPNDVHDDEELEWTKEIVNRSTPKLPEEEVRDWNQSMNSRSTARNPSPPRNSNPAALSFLDMRESRANEPSQKTIYCRLKTPYDVGDVPAANSFDKKFGSSPYSPSKADDEDSFSSEQAAAILPAVTTVTVSKMQEDHTSNVPRSEDIPLSYSPFSSGGLTNYANQSPQRVMVPVPVPQPVPAPVTVMMEESRLVIEKDKEKSRHKDEEADDDDDDSSDSSESSESSESTESSSSSSDSPPEKVEVVSRKSSEKRKRAKDKYERRKAEKRRLAEKYERKLVDRYKSSKHKYDKYDKYEKRSSDKYEKYEKKKFDKHDKKYEKVPYDKHEKKSSDKYEKKLDKYDKKFADKYDKKSSSDSHDRRAFETYEKKSDLYEKMYEKKMVVDSYEKGYDKKLSSAEYEKGHDKKSSSSDYHDKKSSDSYDKKSTSDSHDRKSLSDSQDKKAESHDKKSDKSHEKKVLVDSHEKKIATDSQDKKAVPHDKKTDSQDKKADPQDKKSSGEVTEKKTAIEKLAEKVKQAEKEAEKAENLKKLTEKKKAIEIFERRTLTHPTRKISVKPPRKIHGETLPVKPVIQVIAQKPLVDYPAENDNENVEENVTTAANDLSQPAQITTNEVPNKETVEPPLAKSPSSFEPKFKNSFQPEDALPQRDTTTEDVSVSVSDVPPEPLEATDKDPVPSPPLPPQLPMYEPPLPDEVPTYTPPLPKDSPSHTPPLPPSKPPESPSHTPPLPPPIYSTASDDATITTVTTSDSNQLGLQNFPPFGFFQTQPPPMPNFAFPPPNVNDLPLSFSSTGISQTTFTPTSFSDVNQMQNSFTGTGAMMQPNMFSGMPNNFEMPFMGVPPPPIGVPPPSSAGTDFNFGQPTFVPQPVPPPTSGNSASFIGPVLPTTTNSGDLSYLASQQSQSFIGPHRPPSSSADQTTFAGQATTTTTTTSSDMVFKTVPPPCSTAADFATFMAAQTNNFSTLPPQPVPPPSSKGVPQPVPPPPPTSVSSEFNFMGAPFQGQGPFSEPLLPQPSTNINNEFTNFMNVIQPQGNFSDTTGTGTNFPQPVPAPNMVPQPVAAPGSFMGQMVPNFGQLGSFPIMNQGNMNMPFPGTDKEGEFGFNEQMGNSNRDQNEGGRDQSGEMFFGGRNQRDNFENFGREKRDRRGRIIGINKRNRSGGNFNRDRSGSRDNSFDEQNPEFFNAMGPQGFFNPDDGPPENFFQNNPQEGFFNQGQAFFNQPGGPNEPPFFDGNQPYPRGRKGKQFQGPNFPGNFPHRPPLVPPHGGPPRGPPPRFGEGSLRRGRGRGGRYRSSGPGNFKSRHAGPSDFNDGPGGQGDFSRQPFESPNSDIVSYPSSFKYNKNNGPSGNRLTLLGENGILEPFAPQESRGGHGKRMPEPRY